MAVKKIIQAGDPRLHTKNKSVKSFALPKFKKLIKDLKDSMKKAGLIGIAAPQIAENYMVFITHPRNTKARQVGKIDKLRVYINPKIVFKSQKQNLIYEGCGSVVTGGLFGPVLRPKEIEILAFDETGKKFSLRCDGILARVIQHEMDHLMGIEFLQKVSDYSKIVSQNFYRKNIRNSKEQREASKVTKTEYKKL